MSAANKTSLITSKKISGTRLVLPAYEAPRRCYKTLDEVEKAKADGTFDATRTMFLKNGRLFFMVPSK